MCTVIILFRLWSCNTSSLSEVLSGPVCETTSSVDEAKHFFQAFTIHGDQVYSFPTFRYYSSSQDKVKFLTANVEEDITALVSEIQDLKLKINQASQQKVQLESEMQQNIAIERRTETQLMKIRETKRKYMMVRLDMWYFEIDFIWY